MIYEKWLNDEFRTKISTQYSILIGDLFTVKKELNVVQNQMISNMNYVSKWNNAKQKSTLTFDTVDTL